MSTNQVEETQPGTGDTDDVTSTPDDQTETSTPDLNPSPAPTPADEPNPPAERPFSWWHKKPGDREWKSGIREVLIGVGAAALIAFLGVAYTTITDDRRAEQAERLENLRFIRERSDEKLETPRPFNGMDLTGQNMAGLFLYDADIALAALPDANLLRAILARADLSGTDLSGANLVGTDFTEAILDQAVLTGADLTEAMVDSASFEGANLSDANLLGTRITSLQLSRICKYGDRPPRNLPTDVELPDNRDLTECGR